MSKKFSIAEARRNLPKLIRDAESGESVEITRRGRPVAVVLSLEEYGRLRRGRPNFGDRYDAFRAEVAPEDLMLPDEFWEGLRDQSPGREVVI